MKTYVFSLLAMLFFVCTGNAQKTTESAELKVSTGKNVTTYKYTSLKDFNANANALIDQAAKTNESLSGDGGCTMTITMSVTVTAGSGSFLPGGQVSVTVTGSITVTCAQALQAGIRLREQLTAMATN